MRTAVTTRVALAVALLTGVAGPTVAAGTSVADPGSRLIVTMRHEKWVELPTGYVIVASAVVSEKDVGSVVVDCRAGAADSCYAELNLPAGSLYVHVALRHGGGGTGTILAGTRRFAHEGGRVSAVDTSNTTTVVTVTFTPS